MSESRIDAKIDDLMKRASKVLTQMQYFEAERMANKALGMAREAADFERMARITLPLLEARRQRFQQALDIKPVRILDEPVEDETILEPGCYVVQPPLVGADARRLRLTALAHDVPVALVCREPYDQLGQIPIAAVTPGRTMRTKVEPPEVEDKYDAAWVVEAIEELGDFTLDSLDPELQVVRRIDALLSMIDALPEHERLHVALEETCRRAVHEKAEEAAGKTTKKKRRASGAGSSR